MPKQIDRDLLDCLRRPNPYVEYRVEISAPDVRLVLRRPDQFIGADSLMVSGPTPANSLATGIGQSLQLAPTSVALASFLGESSSYDLNKEDPQRRLKGVSWKVDPTFNRGVLRSVVVRLKRIPVAGVYYYPLDFELQIFRVTRIPGTIGATAVSRYVHHQLLNPGVVVKNANIVWSGSPQKATITFDLQNYGIIVDNGPPDAVSPDQTTELPNYYFVVRPTNPPKTNSLFQWMVDTTTSRTIAGVGTFERSFWNRDSDQEEWKEQVFADCPYFVLNVESYPASGQAVYALDLGRAPAAGTTGQEVFERTVPRGTTALYEIATAGSSGPFTPLTDGDLVTPAQQTYWVRVTLASDTSGRASPGVQAMGIEFRTPIDVSVESILEFPSREISMPWGEASIPEAKLTVIRL